MTTQAQNAAILAYLQTGGTLTQLQALDMFRCLRLSGRIYDLRKQGYMIDSKQITVESGKRVAQYTLINKTTKA